MKVFVVMANDFPDAVFTREDDAKSYCDKMALGSIYWSVYPFELDAANRQISS